MKINIPVKSAVAMAVVLLPFFLCHTVFAHKVSIYAYAEDGKVFAEGYFANGTRVKNSEITVFDGETGKKFFDIKTDESGSAVFKIPRPVSLRLVLNAGMGHESSYIISRKEIQQASGLLPEACSKDMSSKGPALPETDVDTLSPGHNAATDDLEHMVDRVVEKKLQPIKTILLQIRESTEKPRISEVLGGIGYIIGLMGLAMYFKSRKG